MIFPKKLLFSADVLSLLRIQKEVFPAAVDMPVRLKTYVPCCCPERAQQPQGVRFNRVNRLRAVYGARGIMKVDPRRDQLMHRLVTEGFTRVRSVLRSPAVLRSPESTQHFTECLHSKAAVPQFAMA